MKYTHYFLLLFGLLTTAATQAQSATKLLNTTLPPFKLMDLEGKLVTPDSLLGKVVLINTWFTTCTPCLAEIPALNELRAEFDSAEVVMLAMSPDAEGTLQDFLRKQSFHFQHLPAAGAYLAQFGKGYPRNILLDRQGKIRHIQGGIAVLKIDQDRTQRTYVLNSDPIKTKIRQLLQLK